VELDLSSDPTISNAMNQARDTAEPVASGKYAADSFMILVPVYRLGAAVDTVANRRNALLGFTFTPFNARTFLAKIISETTSPVRFEVYDGTAQAAASLLGDPVGDSVKNANAYAASVRVAARDWLVIFRPTEAAATEDSSSAQWTMIGGLALSLLLFFVTDGQVRAWETIAKHEAELRASEQALRQSEAAAQAAGRAKDEFLATLSHELRTPLNAILGWASMLRSGTIEEDRRAHALAVIERNAHLQADLIEDLLDVSRIVRGKVRLQLEQVDLARSVSTAIESLKPGAEAKGVRLQTTTPESPVIIRGDAERLQQIVWNVVSNAIKFTPAGGRIDIDVTCDATHAHVSVRDTGIGIAPEFLSHIFERFSQADSSSTRTHAGLGLGLSIVRNLVELHGGSIQAHSDGPNRGAQFLLHFALATTSENPTGQAVSSEP
jgi:signal transduction histidine kinase